MSTAREIREPEEPRTTVAATPEDQPLTLFEEHGLLLRQVAVRAEELLAVTAGGGWPARELQALLTYMRVEVLRQAVDEERLLFPCCPPSAALDRLGRDHTILHLMTEMLATAATGEGPRIPAELARTTRDLLAHLERHLGSEEAVLAADGGRGEAPGTTVTNRPHAWYALPEGDGIDLAALPAPSEG
ncbi:MAG TPA: hemerythrin domain-containing protein [Mycobacteriales bacterium]